MAMRGFCLRQSCSRLFSTHADPGADFTHVIIGAGVVGLATAHRLAAGHPDARTLLLDRRPRAGTETSARNSGVIHAGLYDPPAALKTTLCHRGRHLLYELCRQRGLPHRRTGKWLIAQDAVQAAALARIHERARGYDEDVVPTRWVGREEARRREPDVRAAEAVLESPSSGVVDVHALMDSLEGRYLELGGEVAYGTDIEGVEPLPGGAGSGFAIRTRATREALGGQRSSADEEDAAMTVTAETLVNSAGLGAVRVANMLLPPHRQVTPRFAKGTYFAYAAPVPRPSVLVYPAPQPGLGGLGTHLTLDLGDPPRVKFGPDVEWIDYDPVRDVMRSPDGKWMNPYVPDPNRIKAALVEIKRYLPGLHQGAIDVDYCGIRAKIGYDPGAAESSTEGFQDFVVRQEDGFDGSFVNLMGIESPGLTSSLAIAERVDQLLYN